ncbi:MAG: phytanoyl-CoA dioxygenase [Planctomycetaceae bacterium]|nr:phytanoyl-CoA dioxygenase [Planctomycetaceae bacterium]
MSPLSTVTAGDLQHFEDQGYVVVRNLLDPDRHFSPVVKEYEELLDGLVDQWSVDGHLQDKRIGLPFPERLLQTVVEARQPYDLAMDISLPQASITDATPMHHGPAVFDLLRTPELLDAVEAFVGPEIYSNPVQHTRIKLPEAALPEEAWTGLTARIDWHQDLGVITDDADTCLLLTVWIPFTSADAENGCLAVVPGSHRRELVTHCTSSHALTRGQVSIPEPLVEPNQVPLPMNPGDVLFLHSLLQHAGLPNKSDRLRWSFDLRYQPIGEPTGREWFPGFIVRSTADPDSVLDDAHAWSELWQDTRTRLAAGGDVSFNRWTDESPYCA